MVEPLIVALLLGGFGAVAWGGFRQPRGVYWKSAAGVAATVLGWAALWLGVSPSNEAGFGFFAIWVVLTGDRAAARAGRVRRRDGAPCGGAHGPEIGG